MTRYWIPPTKWQLVDWLCKYYNQEKAVFNKKNKKQLYAIYYNTIGRIA